MKNIIHISHANGFTGGTYQSLIDPLSQDYDVHAIDRFAHNPNYPVTDNWPHLVTELIHYLEENFDQPIIAVGHSLGGSLSYLVSHYRPDLVKALIMLDTPVMMPWQAWGMRLLKRTGLNERWFPITRIEDRKTEWADFNEAEAYFRSKPLMKNFDERCLQDYISTATEPFDAGIRLRFDPQTEAHIWRTIPHTIHQQGRVKVPAAVIGGTKSNIFQKRHGRYMAEHLGVKLFWSQGSHMFPLENPQRTTEMIQTIIPELLSDDAPT